MGQRPPATEPVLRSENEADHAAVAAIHDAAFAGPLEARIVAELRRSATPMVSLVAELDGRPSGHVAVSPVTVEGRPPAARCAGLGPIAVLPALQRRGLGSALMREALARSAAAGWSAVFLLGDPAYYARFGFELAAPRGYRFESEQFDPAFQVLELEPGALDAGEGWVRYHPAFGV